MSERPKGDGDPDATVMIPAGGAVPAPDPDATVMMPADRPDRDATVMLPAGGPDADATVMMPTAGADPDANALLPAASPDPDATIAIPTPGRRHEAIPASRAADSEAATMPLGALGGMNPLIEAANSILAVVPQIRHALKHPDPDGLRGSLRERIDGFESAARAAGVGEDTFKVASYALCALLDESASCTPWGVRWAKDGLLAERHGDGDGSEKFFELLSKTAEDPAANLDLLEFFYVCLALGFEGRYRGSESGRQDLGLLRTRLHDQVHDYRPSHDGELSGRWRGVSAPARRAPGGLALWAAGSSAALLLVVVYLGYSLWLGSMSDPVARGLAQLKATAPAGRAGTVSAATSAPSSGIGAQLAAEIGRGEVAVTDAAGQITIVIRSDRLFASGSARLERDIEPVVLRVAEALDRVPRVIVVTGHSDDVPIRTARFPSNWELSTERAASVVKLMATKLRDPSRLRAEGLADSEPVAPNDSNANRARNRRVSIILRSPS